MRLDFIHAVPLDEIWPGMRVYHALDKRIGTVEVIYGNKLRIGWRTETGTSLQWSVIRYDHSVETFDYTVLLREAPDELNALEAFVLWYDFKNPNLPYSKDEVIQWCQHSLSEPYAYCEFSRKMIIVFASHAEAALTKLFWLPD